MATSLARQNERLKKNLRKPLASTRVAMKRKITLRFPHFEGFLVEYSSNLSMTGMFVKSDNLEPPGTVVEFEFLLPDAVRLIKGQAQVVWVRERNEGEDRPAGMGLHFVRLDAESRRLIRWTVEKQVLEEGTLVELEEIMGAPKNGTDDGVDRSKLHPYAGAAMARSSASSGRGKPVALAAALGGVLLVGGWLYSAPRESEAPTAVREAPVEAPAQVQQRVRAEPAEVVESWARAWSDQRVDDYLSFYSAEFRPANGMARDAWAAQRRSRIAGPAFIAVEIAELVVVPLSPEMVEVTFRQDYASDRFSDTVRKTVEMTLEGGQWKIAAER